MLPDFASLSARTALAAISIFASVAIAQGAETTPHAARLAAVHSFKPIEGFNHVIGATRYVGYFTQRDGGCAVTVITAGAEDTALVVPPKRMELVIPAADRTEIEAEGGRALAIGCTVDADQIKLVTLEPLPMRAASRN